MGPADVTVPDTVVQAMHEYDERGRDAFLAKYGFGKSTNFVVADNGRLYDPHQVRCQATSPADGSELQARGPGLQNHLGYDLNPAGVRPEVLPGRLRSL